MLLIRPLISPSSHFDKLCLLHLCSVRQRQLKSLHFQTWPFYCTVVSCLQKPSGLLMVTQSAASLGVFKIKLVPYPPKPAPAGCPLFLFMAPPRFKIRDFFGTFVSLAPKTQCINSLLPCAINQFAISVQSLCPCPSYGLHCLSLGLL